MKKLTYGELETLFGEHNARTDINPYDEPLHAVIVYNDSKWKNRAFRKKYVLGRFSAFSDCVKFL